MPRSRKHNSKKVKNNKTKKIIGGANLSNPNIGFIMVDHIDPTSNLRIDLDDLTPFYKHFELLQEPTLFNENFEEKIDKAYENVGKQVSRMMGEVSEEETQSVVEKITSESDEDVSVLNINFFRNVANSPQPAGKTIQYEIINKDKKTIDFLMIVQKFKLLQHYCSNSEINSKYESSTTLILNAVKVAVTQNPQSNFKTLIENNKNKTFNLINGLIDFLNKVFETIVAALKPKQSETKGIHPFSLLWNDDEIKVLQEYQPQSNTIYGILVKFCFNDIENNKLTIDSEFISSPKPSSILASIEKITEKPASESVDKTKSKMILSKGADDFKKVIEEILKLAEQDKLKLAEQDKLKLEQENRIIEFEKTTPGKFIEGSSVSESLLDKKKYYMIKNNKNVKKLLGFFIGGSTFLSSHDLKKNIGGPTFLSSHDLKKNSIDNVCLDNKKLKNDCELYYSNDKTYIDNRLKEAVKNTNKIEDYNYKREFDKIIEQIQIN